MYMHCIRQMPHTHTHTHTHTQKKKKKKTTHTHTHKRAFYAGANTQLLDFQ